MVEGPGCKVKGETMKPRIKGKLVSFVSGTAVKQKTGRKRTRSADGSMVAPRSVSQFEVLVSQRVTDVKTLGKELFIFFEQFELCLRVHFLMSGGYRLNGQKLDGDGGGESNAPVLVLHLTNARDIGISDGSEKAVDKLTFNKSAADVRPAQLSLERIKNLLPLDICYEQFNQQRALALVLEQQNRQVCDVLLDQQILPGVGNIIKNEALFDSAVKPDTLVRDLTEPHIVHLIKMTRDFSMVFYKCRRDGKSLQPHLKIYNKSVCRQCRGRCVTTRLGEDAHRLTMFCPHCQDNDFSRFTERQSSTKNSLLGWMKKSDCVQKDWSCEHCTLINTGNRANCELCHAPKTEMDRQGTSEACHALTTKLDRQGTSEAFRAAKTKTDWRGTSQVEQSSVEKIFTIQPSIQPITQPFVQPVTEQCIQSEDRILFDHSEIPYSVTESCKIQSVCVTKGEKQFTFHKRKSISEFKILREENTSNLQNEVMDSKSSSNLTSSRKGMSGTLLQANTTAEAAGSHLRPPLRSILGNQPGQPVKDNQKSGKTSIPPLWEPVPCLGRTQKCETHNVVCIRRQVHKKGDNLHRMFWSCPRGKACNFFKWADSEFPVCEVHGRPSILRTVYKQGANNSRRFFACPLPKNKQCGFFQWADQPATA